MYGPNWFHGMLLLWAHSLWEMNKVAISPIRQPLLVIELSSCLYSTVPSRKPSRVQRQDGELEHFLTKPEHCFGSAIGLPIFWMHVFTTILYLLIYLLLFTVIILFNTFSQCVIINVLTSMSWRGGVWRLLCSSVEGRVLCDQTLHKCLFMYMKPITNVLLSEGWAFAIMVATYAHYWSYNQSFACYLWFFNELAID